MPIYELSSAPVFPDPRNASKDGLLAYGGDLSPRRLVAAYQQGIFPWYDERSPDLLWWSPDPRLILYPDKFKVSKSLRQKLNRNTFDVKVDTAFAEVMDACSKAPREGQDGTWITAEMKSAYGHLHRLGIAHSVECWQDNVLVGGLYGLCLGNVFFGESMFHKVTDASKVAFYSLAQIAKKMELGFIDCQMPTDHLLSLGAEVMSRSDYLDLLAISNQSETKQGIWT